MLVVQCQVFMWLSTNRCVLTHLLEIKPNVTQSYIEKGRAGNELQSSNKFSYFFFFHALSNKVSKCRDVSFFLSTNTLNIFYCIYTYISNRIYIKIHLWPVSTHRSFPGFWRYLFRGFHILIDTIQQKLPGGGKGREAGRNAWQD